MTDTITIALDGMGGDYAPESVVAGANMALKKLPKTVQFNIYGDEKIISPMMDKFPKLKKRVRLFHTDEAVLPDDKPSFALRKRKKSSMQLAINSVRDGDANAIVSSGNTGALMALSLFTLRPIENVSRPAICSPMPTERGASVMLDLGANVECDADNLVQFAIMGVDYARTVLHVQKPTVGLLNIGSEEMKGRDEIRLAAEILKGYDDDTFTYYGFVEGDDIAKGTVDVIVTDGFTGNVALKSIEGLAKLMGTSLKQSIKRNAFSWLGIPFIFPALSGFRKQFDARRHNGAVLAGLNGIVVKSHGGTDALGFATAIDVAFEMARDGYAESLKKHLES